MTVLSNQKCKLEIDANIEDSCEKQVAFKNAYPKGLDSSLICAQGIYNEEKGVYSGLCYGDAGVPLTVRNDQNQNTLIGVLSAKIECFKGIPELYTRIYHYTSWIRCVIDKSLQFDNNFAEVEKSCTQIRKEPGTTKVCKGEVDHTEFCSHGPFIDNGLSCDQDFDFNVLVDIRSLG